MLRVGRRERQVCHGCSHTWRALSRDRGQDAESKQRPAILQGRRSATPELDGNWNEAVMSDSGGGDDGSGSGGTVHALQTGKIRNPGEWITARGKGNTDTSIVKYVAIHVRHL